MRRATNDRMDRALALLTVAANAGAPCPSNADLAELLDAESISSPVRILKKLEDCGLIKVQRGNCARIVEIVSTGKRTAEVTLHPRAGAAVA